MIDPDAAERGESLMRQLGISPEKMRKTFQSTSPKLADHIIEHAYGLINSDTTLDLKTRQLLTISVLATIGACEAELGLHLLATRRAGGSDTEIYAALTHITPYIGIPKVMNAVQFAEQILNAPENSHQFSSADEPTPSPD